jgi:glyoxylase-like metal-dependent hydrolase (beta-lactamase superfamily II)
MLFVDTPAPSRRRGMRAGKTPKRQHTNRGEPKHRSPERRRKVSDEDTLVHGKTPLASAGLCLGHRAETDQPRIRDWSAPSPQRYHFAVMTRHASSRVRLTERVLAMLTLTRRALLAGSALAAISAPAGPSVAAAPPAGKEAPGIYRYRIGTFELTALYDGIWYRPITDKFIHNAPFAEVETALADAFMPADKLATPFTTLIVNTGKKLVLIDTGTGGQIAPSAGVLRANLVAAGIDPRAIDLIVISHFHPDHINGIKDKDNDLVFPNAEIMVPGAEWKFWMDDANLNAAPTDLKLTFRNQRRIFSDIARNVTRFEPGAEVAPGIATLAAPGHTPGHTVFAIHSGDQSLMVLGDTAQHPAVFARHPDWQAAFDIDGDAAVATRKKLFDRAAADRMLVTGYHFPFPACGHLVKTASGYEHVAVEWQPNL